jgi:class 3 adenylate cyclase
MKMNETEKCRMVIGVTEVADFDNITENKTDFDTYKMLKEFYKLVEDLLNKTGGKVVKFLGKRVLFAFPDSHAKQSVSYLEELKSQAQSIWSEFDLICNMRTKIHIGLVELYDPHIPGQGVDVIGKPVNDLFLMPWDGPELSDELKQFIEN